MRPFRGARLVLAALFVAGGVGMGAAIAGAGVPTHGGGWDHSDDECEESHGWHHAPSWCHETTTRPTSTSTTKPHVVPPTTTTTTEATTTTTTTKVEPVPTPATPELPKPASVSLTPRASTRTSAAPVTPRPAPPAIAPAPAPTPIAIPGVDHLFNGTSGISFAMALVIGVAGLATVAFVLRGTFGRHHAPLVTPDEGESLKFR